MSKVSSFELEGKQAYQHKKYSKAAKLFGQAQLEYQDLNELVKSAEMANNQSVALLQTGKNKKALAALSGTEEIFEQHAEKLQLALAIGNKAAALDALKRTDEAEEPRALARNGFKRRRNRGKVRNHRPVPRRMW